MMIGFSRDFNFTGWLPYCHERQQQEDCAEKLKHKIIVEAG
jgi:hypothetical protein